MKPKHRQHAQSTITTTTTETEEPTDDGSDPDAASMTTEGPIWSPPVSQTTETAGTAMTTYHSEETTRKTSPKLRNETGEQGSRVTTLEYTVQPKNS